MKLYEIKRNLMKLDSKLSINRCQNIFFIYNSIYRNLIIHRYKRIQY